MISTIVAFVLTIAFLILIHEWGHFFVARRFKVWVHQFAIGFGPALLRYKPGETEYSLRVFPIGGFVRLAGDEPENEEDKAVPSERLFTAKKPLARMAIISAGPFMNILGAVVLMILAVGLFGVPYLEIADFTPDSAAKEQLLIGDKIVKVEGKNIYTAAQLNSIIQRKAAGGSAGGTTAATKQPQPVTIEVKRGEEVLTFTVTPRWSSESQKYLIGVVFQNPPASTTNKIRKLDHDAFLAKQGLQQGDKIIEANGKPVYSFWGFVKALEGAIKKAQKKEAIEAQSHLSLLIVRGGQNFSYTLDLKEIKKIDEALKGVQPELDTRRPGPITSVALGITRAWDIVVLLYQTFKGMISGRIPAGEAFTGPVGIASFLGQSLNQGLMSFFMLVAVLSLNLGIINLLPFPALDGSRLLFLTYELIRRKPFPPQKEGWVHYIGFIILIGLMLLITYKDILRLLR